MRELLERRCEGRNADERLFDGLSADHVTEMTVRAGAPAFTLSCAESAAVTKMVSKRCGMSMQHVATLGRMVQNPSQNRVSGPLSCCHAGSKSQAGVESMGCCFWATKI
jgi:hypothetical protein